MNKWMLSTFLLLLLIVGLTGISFVKADLQGIGQGSGQQPRNFEIIEKGCGIEGQACNGWSSHCCTKGGSAYRHTCVGGVWDAGGWCGIGKICSTEGAGGRCTNP